MRAISSFSTWGGREREREIGVMVGIETGHLTLSLASRQRWVSLVFMDDIRERERERTDVEKEERKKDTRVKCKKCKGKRGKQK